MRMRTRTRKWHQQWEWLPVRSHLSQLEKLRFRVSYLSYVSKTT